MSMTDAELAAHLAAVTGRLLLEVRDCGVCEGKALGKAGDQTANQYLVHAIRAARPDDGLLSEEMKCDGTRLDQSRVWIVDPVDGTREYGEGREDWAVHVALAIDGVATVGAVSLPALGLVLRSDQPDPPAPAGRSAAHGRQPDAPACAGAVGGRRDRRDARADGIIGGKGDGGGARGGRHLPSHRRPV